MEGARLTQLITGCQGQRAQGSHGHGRAKQAEMGKLSRETAYRKWAVIVSADPFPLLSQYRSFHFQAASWKCFLPCLRMPKVPELRQKLSGQLITKRATINTRRAGAVLFLSTVQLFPPSSTAPLSSLSGVGQSQPLPVRLWDFSLSPCLRAFGAMQYFLL